MSWRLVQVFSVYLMLLLFCTLSGCSGGSDSGGDNSGNLVISGLGVTSDKLLIIEKKWPGERISV